MLQLLRYWAGILSGVCVCSWWMYCVDVLSVNRQIWRLAARPSLPVQMSAVWRDWQACTSAPIFLTYDSFRLCLASDECCRQPLTTRSSSHSPNSMGSIWSSLVFWGTERIYISSQQLIIKWALTLFYSTVSHSLVFFPPVLCYHWMEQNKNKRKTMT